MSSNYQNLIEKLDEFIRKYYKNLLLRGLIYSTALVLLFFVVMPMNTALGQYAQYYHLPIAERNARIVEHIDREFSMWNGSLTDEQKKDLFPKIWNDDRMGF